MVQQRAQLPKEQRPDGPRTIRQLWKIGVAVIEWAGLVTAALRSPAQTLSVRATGLTISAGIVLAVNVAAYLQFAIPVFLTTLLLSLGIEVTFYFGFVPGLITATVAALLCASGILPNVGNFPLLFVVVAGCILQLSRRFSRFAEDIGHSLY